MYRYSPDKNLYVMFLSQDTAKITAQKLLSIGAIKLATQNPFKWSSGWWSPIYCDNRITLSEVPVRDFLKEQLAEIILKKYKPDLIAGVATGAIAMGVLVAEKLGLPFVYVRPEPKKHGRKNQIEGKITSGQKVVVIEDLISTGKSSLNAVDALRKADSEVLGMVAIFSYGLEIAYKNFQKYKLPLDVLSHYECLLEQAVADNFISKDEVTFLKKWRAAPELWAL